MEIWKDITNYEGIYQISSCGRVRSLYYKKFKILKLRQDKYGYYQIDLHKNNNVRTFKVHRLVAEAFIHNPNNYPQVNHKDENKTNNKIDNLEWCTNYYNRNYGTRNKRASEKCKKEVICITTGEIFNSIKEASVKYNVNSSYITANCKGRQKSAGKHPITGEKLIWDYSKK